MADKNWKQNQCSYKFLFQGFSNKNCQKLKIFIFSHIGIVFIVFISHSEFVIFSFDRSTSDSKLATPITFKHHEWWNLNSWEDFGPERNPVEHSIAFFLEPWNPSLFARQIWNRHEKIYLEKCVAHNVLHPSVRGNP